MDEGVYTNFVEQRWTLRFDRLDLTGVDPTRGVPGVPPRLDARRDYKYVGSKVLRKTRDGRSVRGVVSAYDPTLKFDSDEPNGYKVMYDDGRSEWLQEGLLLEILVPEPTLAPPTKRPGEVRWAFFIEGRAPLFAVGGRLNEQVIDQILHVPGLIRR